MPDSPLPQGGPHAQDDGVRLATHAMGTRFEFVLHGQDPVRLRAAGEAALAEVLSLHHRLSAFDPASEVSRLNREAGGGWVRVDEQVFELLALCGDVWSATRGAFDITVGPLMRAWGFRGSGSPDAAAIEAARRQTGFDKVELDRAGRRVRYRRPNLQLDLGAVGKGFALDAAAELLREAGVPYAFLHGGTSSCVAIGAGPEAGGWRVRLGDAADGPIVALKDAALGVSSPAGRTVMGEDGRALGHVLDPRCGTPACGARHAAALAGSAALADAWSTAALVLESGVFDCQAEASGVSLGVQVDAPGPGGWTFQGCWPFVDVQRRDHALAGV